MNFWTVLDANRPTAAAPVVIGFQRYLYSYLYVCTTYLHTFVFFRFWACVYPVQIVQIVQMRTVINS